MQPVRHVETAHDDLVHDVAFDFFGRRMATCSSDQKIKVWSLKDYGASSASASEGLGSQPNGQWRLDAEWKAHSGSVWRLTWAHPQFGCVLASCSFDRTVQIWEEQEDANGAKSWKNVMSLVDARDSVQDLAFAPASQGLKLATASADGWVRVYAAPNVTNLSQWPLVEEFESEKGGVLALCWNPSPFDRPTLAVSSHNVEAAVKLWEYNETLRRWIHVETLTGHSGAVHDVAWSPFIGRSYHLVATASKDQTVRLWRIEYPSEAQKAALSGTTPSSVGLKVETEAVFDSHNAEVWRVSWNITGTVLSSSGDDGNIRLFRRAFSTGKWELLDTIAGHSDVLDQ